MHHLNEEKDFLASNVRQEAAHCSAMETEHVSAKDILSSSVMLFLFAVVITAS